MSGSGQDGVSAETLEGIRVVFFQECDDLTAQLETGLLALQEGDRDPEVINSVFRAAHSIKGGAGIFGLDQLVRFAHQFEGVLADARAQRLELNDDGVRVLLRASDILCDLVRVARDGGTLDPSRLEPVERELAAMSAPEAAEEADDILLDFTPTPVVFDDLPEIGGERAWIVRFRPYWDLYAKANEPVNLLRDLARLGEARVTLDEGALPLLADLDPEEAYLSWTVELRTSRGKHAIYEVFEFVEGDCDLEVLEMEAQAEPVAPEPAVLEVHEAAVETVVDAPVSSVASTPSAPASAGVTDGQRTRSRVMDSASVMFSLR